MKKYLFLLLFLASCKSISYQDVNPNIDPNKNLLPALDPIIDNYNLKSTYSISSYSGTANVYSAKYKGDSKWEGGTGTTSVSGTKYVDPRVSDAINIFYKEVNENITSPYGTKKGYISLRLGYRGTDWSYIYPAASIASLFTLNLAGFPCDKLEESLEVEVQIMNTKKEIVGRYVENVINYDYIAAWWGYDKKDIFRKVAATNLITALEKIRYKINNDAPELKKKLK